MRKRNRLPSPKRQRSEYIGVRWPAPDFRAILNARRPEETVSETVRRLVLTALKAAENSPEKAAS